MPENRDISTDMEIMKQVHMFESLLYSILEDRIPSQPKVTTPLLLSAPWESPDAQVLNGGICGALT